MFGHLLNQGVQNRHRVAVVRELGVGERLLPLGHGAGGIRKFTKQQSIFISRVHLKNDVYMFPYRPKVSKALFRGLRLLYGRRRRR